MIGPIDLTAALLALAPLRESMGLLGEAERVLLEVDRGGFTSEDLRELDPLQSNGELRVNGVAVFVHLYRVPEPSSTRSLPKVHFVLCRTLQSMITQGESHRYKLTRQTSGRFDLCTYGLREFRADLEVCGSCLLGVHWDGYEKDWTDAEKRECKARFDYEEYLRNSRSQSVRHHRAPLSQTVVEQRLWRGSAYEAVRARFGRRG